MLYSLVIIVLAGAAFELCNARRRYIFKSGAGSILKAARNIQCNADPELLPGLPDPVAHYLARALPEALPIIRTARLRYDGYFKTSLEKNWINIKGEQYFKGIKPGFIWKGQTKIFTAVDSYLKNAGNLSVWFLSAIRIVNKQGTYIDDGEIIRWLAESALVPSNFLPSGNLSWEAVDAKTARLVYKWRQKKYILLVYFNGHNEIEAVETHRPLDGKSIHEWKGRFSNYKKVEGYNVPSALEACWIIDGIEKPYARFRIKSIEYNITDCFP